MIIEIKYKALHWDNHQGGSGKPFCGRILRNVEDLSLSEVLDYAKNEMEMEKENREYCIGDFFLEQIIIDAN